MSESKSSDTPLAPRAPVDNKMRKNTEEKPRKKHFDSYEECGCVDRWEAEGGPVVGEDQSETPAG